MSSPHLYALPCYTQPVFHHELLWHLHAYCSALKLVRKHSGKLIKSSSTKHVISSSPAWEPKHPAVQQTQWQTAIFTSLKNVSNIILITAAQQKLFNRCNTDINSSEWRPLGPTQGKTDSLTWLLRAVSVSNCSLSGFCLLQEAQCPPQGLIASLPTDYRHSSRFLSVLHCLTEFFFLFGERLSPCSCCFLAQSSRGQCTTGCLAPAFGTNSSSSSVRAITWQHLQQQKIHLFSLVC